MITVHTCEQGSAEWLQARLGIPTASEFECIVKRLKNGKHSSERQKYLYTLAGQRITGEIVESYSGGYLERGKIMEDEARKLYEFQTDTATERVGFVTNGVWRAGASPDSFVGTDGAIEIKTKLPHLHIECLETGDVPEDHIAQCQGVLGVSGRAWIDFVSYWPKMPLFVKRLQRDDAYISSLIVDIAAFNAELDALVAKYS